jgi:hypothetical protein
MLTRLPHSPAKPNLRQCKSLIEAFRQTDQAEAGCQIFLGQLEGIVSTTIRAGPSKLSSPLTLEPWSRLAQPSSGAGAPWRSGATLPSAEGDGCGTEAAGTGGDCGFTDSSG